MIITIFVKAFDYFVVWAIMGANIMMVVDRPNGTGVYRSSIAAHVSVVPVMFNTPSKKGIKEAEVRVRADTSTVIGPQAATDIFRIGDANTKNEKQGLASTDDIL